MVDGGAAFGEASLVAGCDMIRMVVVLFSLDVVSAAIAIELRLLLS